MRFTFLFFCVASLAAAAPCHTLLAYAAPNVTITFAETTAATTMLAPGGPAKTPAFCRVAGVIRPSADSDIHFEVWMPETAWNGNFRGAGNGGFAGSMNYTEMAGAIRDGYAAASTDTGHRADGIDANWALGHPERITDFGYRAIHEMTVQAKAIVAAFYPSPLKHSFFSSCSNGGRQALMEAQRYPEDYDGIVAGAPAYYWTHLLTANYYASALPMIQHPASYIPKEKIPAIAKGVREACDAADGLQDGIISDPQACHFDPETIVCKGAESDACLTAPQAASLKRIYQGAESVFPGYEPGGEEGPGGWEGWITGDKPGNSAGALFSTGFLRNMVFSNTAWKATGTSLADTLRAADAKMAGALNATEANLKPFQARGGKLIMYHGWSDAAIPPTNSISYFEQVSKTMDPSGFVRLYMVPGMQHCGGGPGPNVFNAFDAVVSWVEKGTGPASLTATKSTGGKVEMTRPLCPYPQVAKYGNGDFACALP